MSPLSWPDGHHEYYSLQCMGHVLRAHNHCEVIRLQLAWFVSVVISVGPIYSGYIPFCSDWECKICSLLFPVDGTRRQSNLQSWSHTYLIATAWKKFHLLSRTWISGLIGGRSPIWAGSCFEECSSIKNTQKCHVNLEKLCLSNFSFLRFTSLKI